MLPGASGMCLNREASQAAAGLPRGHESSQKLSMTRNSQERRTPEQIRASNRRLGLILLTVAAVFFAGAVIKQVWFS
jgi:hypothetical protein